MKNVLIYFFGQGTEPEFSLFTFAHFAPIAVMLATIFLIRRYRDSLRLCRREETNRLALALVCIVFEMSYYWRLAAIPSLSGGVVENLPLGVCGWALIFSSYMLAAKNQTFFDIVYFWLLACTTFALLTPTPITYTGPTRFRYYQFWIGHTIGYVAVFYMIFVHNFRPTLRSLAKSYAAVVHGDPGLFRQPDDPRRQLSLYGPARGSSFHSGYPACQFRPAGDHHGHRSDSAVLCGISALVLKRQKAGKGITKRRPLASFQTVQKASQNFPRKRKTKSKTIFRQGVYLTENTSQAASVEFVC